jgi:hypothetical protein
VEPVVAGPDLHRNLFLLFSRILAAKRRVGA